MTSVAPELAAQASLAHLLGRVAVVEVGVRVAVARRRRQDPDPDDPVRGLYLSDDYVSWVLDRDGSPGGGDDAAAMRARLEEDAAAAEERGLDLRLRRLTRDLGLTPVEEELLVVALAPMLDRRFGQLYGYLNDDVTRRFATVSLAAELARGTPAADPRDWLLVAPASRLVSAGLVEVVDEDLPVPVRSVRVTERTLAFLLGDDVVATDLASLVEEVVPLPLVDPALAAVPLRTLVIEQRPGTDAAVEAATWLSAHHRVPLVLRLTGGGAQVTDDLARSIVREALLTGRVPVIGPVEHSDATALARLAAALPCVLAWSTGPVPGLPRVVLEVPPLEHRRTVWRTLVPGLRAQDVEMCARYRIGAAAVRRAVGAPGLEPPDRATLEDAVRDQDAGMGTHARRVRPVHGWSDLVLPVATTRTLRELIGMVRHRDDVVDTWGLGRAGSARGVTALFAGQSGTGKTLAAEVLAHELGVDLFTVDLARVVDKYVGETEKNLDRVLAAAEGVTGVLFFDEADALFGKRGEVRNGQDRYANLEVSYLLQRVEAAGSVVVLATNLRSQVDEAFLRRMDAVVEFPLPDAEARERIWRGHLARVPVQEADVEFCARSFELAGGHIRNVVVAAACLAAEAERHVTMADLVRGLEREHEKLGRLRVRTDFGRYAHLLGQEVTS